MDHRPSLILYGSETGTAEEVAFKLHRQLSRQNLRFIVSCLDDYDISLLPSETCIVWVVATSGEGEVPSNMKRFWNFLLRRSLSVDSLKDVSCAVFGLGDSSYEKFNAAARRLSKRLQQLGSKEIIPIGLGDDQSKYGYFSELDSWVTKLLPILQSMERIKTNLNPSATAAATTFSGNSAENQMFPEHYRVTVLNTSRTTDNATEFHQLPYRKEELSSLHSLFIPPDNLKHHRCQNTAGGNRIPSLLPILALVKENSRMTESSWSQDVRHIVLSLSTPTPNLNSTSNKASVTTAAAVISIDADSASTSTVATATFSNSPATAQASSHIAGDVATVYPVNDVTLVRRMIAMIKTNETHLNAESSICIECLPGFIKRKSRLGAVQSCQLGRLLSSFLDIAGLPQRGFFEGLAAHATSEEEKEKLLEISSAEGTDLYYDYCLKERRNYVEVLEDFKSSRPPLTRLIELLPVLQPRHYSIANSGLVCADEAHLCVAVTSSKTPYGRVRVGVCSAYLSSLSPGDQVLFWVRSGSFKPPVRAGISGEETPMILVGPGTGVAPMRALIQERRASKPDHREVSSNLKTLLFFGCRNRGNDFLYGNEWESSRIARSSGIADMGIDGADDSGIFTSSSETVVVAFSRDQQEKIYVTDKIKESGMAVWNLLEQGASVFISGSAKRMPADVRKALKGVIQTHGLKSEDEANALLLSMEKKGKYVVEAWS